MRLKCPAILATGFILAGCRGGTRPVVVSAPAIVPIVVPVASPVPVPFDIPDSLPPMAPRPPSLLEQAELAFTLGNYLNVENFVAPGPEHAPGLWPDSSQHRRLRQPHLFGSGVSFTRRIRRGSCRLRNKCEAFQLFCRFDERLRHTHSANTQTI